MNTKNRRNEHVKGKKMDCNIYDLNEKQHYKYVVILSNYNGKIMLSRHKKRTTWETQGGHIEKGENPLEAAKRELFEESGAIRYQIRPAFAYLAGEGESKTAGMVFLANIQEIGKMPESEMAEIAFFDELPANLTYPQITPVLFERAEQLKQEELKVKIEPFFRGWQETLLWSYLQGHMGYAIADDEENPKSAQIVVGDFCFFAGEPNEALVAQAAAAILIPRTQVWENVIEKIWGDGAEKTFRYAIKKEKNIFDKERLREYIESLEEGYILRSIDREIYNKITHEEWARDLCSQFFDYEDYEKRGIGMVVLYQGKIVSGASSYTIYDGGIEIEIDTKQEFRQRGLATVCGAALILECLKRGLYPSWDAHDLRSVALAEKYGYHMDRPYTVYIKK